MNPGKILTSVAQLSAKTQIKGLDDFGQSPTIGGQDNTQSQHHHPDILTLGLARCVLPLTSQPGQETFTRLAIFRQGSVTTITIKPCGGGIDKDHALITAFYTFHHIECGRQSTAPDFSFAATSPKPVKDRLSRQIDQGVTLCGTALPITGNNWIAFDNFNTFGQNLTGRFPVPAQADNLITPGYQPFDQMAPHQTGAAGNKNTQLESLSTR